MTSSQSRSKTPLVSRRRKLIKRETFEQKDFLPTKLIQQLTDHIYNDIESIDNKNRRRGNTNNPSTASSKKEFDPKPFLNMFDDAIQQIRDLRAEVDQQIEGCASNAKEMEANYKSQLSGFMSNLQNIMHEFRNLDGKISRVSQTAIRIGDKLESVEDQRQTIIESHDLINHFLKFNKGATAIDPIFRDDRGPKLYKAARLIIRLKEISNDMASPNTKQAKDLIHMTASEIQRHLTQEFTTAHQSHIDTKFEIMYECASILHAFEDNEALDTFLKLYIRDIDYNTYKYSSYEDISKCIVEFMKSITVVFETACKSIIKCFPDPSLVIRKLIIKIFDTQIMNYLESAIAPILQPYPYSHSQQRKHGRCSTDVDIEYSFSQESESVSYSELNFTPEPNVGGSDQLLFNNNLHKLSMNDREEYLIIVNVVYTHTLLLLKNLKLLVFQIVFNGDIEQEHNIALIINDDVLKNIVFGKRQRSYISLEKRHLKTKLLKLVNEFVICTIVPEEFEPVPIQRMTSYESSMNLPSTEQSSNNSSSMVKFTSKLKKSTKSVKNMISTKNRTTTAENVKRNKLLKMSKLSKRNLQLLKKYKSKVEIKLNLPSSAKERELMFRRLEVVLQIKITECVARMQKTALKSIERCINISEANHLGSNVHGLFLIYLDIIEELFLKHLLPVCKQTMPNVKQKKIQNWYYLEAIQTTNSALQLLEQFYINHILPQITDTFERSSCERNKLEIYSIFENHISAGLKTFINTAIHISQRILKDYQKKDDFRLKSFAQNISTVENDDQMMEMETYACIKLCDFISVFQRNVIIFLDGKNLDVLFNVFGKRLYFTIVEHLKGIKNFTYNGGMILLNDCKKYEKIMRSYHIQEVNDLFLSLVERSTLLTMPAESLQAIVIHRTDNKLAMNLSKVELKEWLKLRADYKSAKIEQKLFG